MTDRTKTQGLLALSPLIVFLGIYLISSIVAGDFYKIPIASAFLIASAYGLLISKKGRSRTRYPSFHRAQDRKTSFSCSGYSSSPAPSRKPQKK